MADAGQIRNAAQWVRDVGARLGTGNPGHDLTGALADLLDRFAVDAEYEDQFGGVRGFHVQQLDRLVEFVETAARDT